MQVEGSILLNQVKCQHCDNNILGEAMVRETICKKCGAKYKLISVTTLHSDIDNEIKAEYQFENFNCIQLEFFDKCKNTCPAPFMFCKDHTNDTFIKISENMIERAEIKLVESKEKLELIKKSKKNWMITELSGIDNE